METEMRDNRRMTMETLKRRREMREGEKKMMKLMSLFVVVVD